MTLYPKAKVVFDVGDYANAKDISHTIGQSRIKIFKNIIKVTSLLKLFRMFLISDLILLYKTLFYIFTLYKC